MTALYQNSKRIYQISSAKCLDFFTKCTGRGVYIYDIFHRLYTASFVKILPQAMWVHTIESMNYVFVILSFDLNLIWQIWERLSRNVS